ncbi:MAG: hypothetical protein ACLRVQ_07365 [Lachnospiraceae bacterium]
MDKRKTVKIIIIDILVYAVAMGVFLALFYLVPYTLENTGFTITKKNRKRK